MGSADRPISLAPQSVIDLAPLDFVETAARAGFSDIGLRAVAGAPRTPRGSTLCLVDEAMLGPLRSAIAAHGLAVGELEYVMVDDSFCLADLEPALAIGGALGARHLVAVVGDADAARRADNLAALALAARAHGMRVVIECVPWLPIDGVAAAEALVRSLPEAGLGILVDMLHLFRSGAGPAELAALDPALTPYLQFCDAPAECPTEVAEMRRQSSEARIDPGAGGLDLPGALSARAADLPLSLEVPNRARVAELGALAHVRMIRAATLALLGRLAE